MSIFTGVPDIAADLISGTFGPIGAAAASLAEQTFTDNTVEEMKANNERYNEALNYDPRTDMGKAANKGAMEAIGEGAAAVGKYYTENEEKIPDVVKSSVGAVANTWNDLDESTRFALGNLATVGEVVPIGKAASMLRRGSKLAPEDIMPDGVPTKDPMQPVPELQDGTSAPRLPAERAAMTPNVDELGYTSGIEEGIIAMINDPKVPDNVSAKQLMDLLKKRGVKDDEIEWSTFSDYVGTLGKKQLPLEEALRQARDRAITLEVIDMPEDKQKFYEYSPYGGDNYSEVLFKFDTTGKIREQREPLRSDRNALEKELAELNAKRIDREVEIQEQQTLAPFLPRHLQSPSAVRARFDIGNAVKNEMPLSKVEVKKAEELRDINKRISDLTYDIERATFKKGHWRFTKNVDTSNVIFHARTTDREIGGDDSLAIDEIQSDWHQGKGDVEDRPYYKLPEDKLKPHIESIIKQADKVASDSSKKWKNLKEQSKELSKENQRLLRIIKENPEDQNAIAAFNDVRSKKKSLREQRVIIKRKGMAAELEYDEHKKQLSKLNEHGYVLFTKDLRPNAPLKNKDKWMGAALNAMLYKAVKGGYGSISFPNGKIQSDLYRGNLDDNQIEALEKMYDTTVPNMLTKMAKKLDPNAKLIRGKDSSVTKPIPSRPVRAEAETEYTFEEWEEVLEEWEADANAGISTGKYDPVNSGYSYIEITVEMRDAILKGKPLFLAEGGYVSGAVDVATDFLSGTFGPIGAAGASLAEQAFTDNTVEEMKANNEKYNDFLNYKPRTQMGRSANESFLETMGEGAEAVVDYYNENEENIPDAVKNAVGAVADTWNDLDESTRFALGNLATVGEVLPMGKAASLAKRGINNASDTRRINRAASQVPDESEYYPVQDRLSAMGARQEMAAPTAVHKNGNPLGINVREGKDGTDFADLIVKGDKKYETRDTRSLDPYVGKSVGIVKTGKEKAALVGYATVGEPLEVDKEMFDALRSEHMVAEGSEFYIKEGGTKFLYPMSEVLSIEPSELPSKYKGIVARQIGESSNLKPTVAKNAEGKLVDINEFKGVTRLGADGNKLDTNMRATSYVATKEEIAATKKDRKDWKNTPEAKEKSTLNQEKIDAPTREEWRTRNKKANKQPRNLKLRDAAAKSMANEITPAEYQALVDKISPATIYTLEDISKKGFFPSTKEVEYALNLDKSMGIVGKDVRDISRDLNKDSVSIEDGTMVASRLDIPAYEQYDTWVVSLHDGSKSGGDSMAYGQTAVLKNVVFDTSTTGAAGISQGNVKNTIGRMYGEWLNQDPESVYAKAKELLADPDSDWVQVGYNPERHSFFYKKDGEIPLDSAEEVIQVGPLVMARGVKLNSIDDPKYTVQPSKMTKGTGQWNKGGLVEEMEAITKLYGRPNRLSKRSSI